jgi:hypothetical protein
MERINMLDSKTQITVGVLSLIGVLGTALFSNWDKVFPSPPYVQSDLPTKLNIPISPSPLPSPLSTALSSPQIALSPTSPAPKPSIVAGGVSPATIPSPVFNSAVQSAWTFSGKASTGESVFVKIDSIQKNANRTDFTYRIGSEQVEASAECESSSGT